LHYQFSVTRGDLARMGTSRHSAALNEVPDETLMEKYADGDTGAFEELFRRFEPRAYFYFTRRTGSPERARDLYQELFFRIHRARQGYDAARAFAPWFFQIAHRLWVDDQRRSYRAREVAIGEHEPCGTGSRDEVADRELLGQMLDTLSAGERYVLVSAKVEGIAYSKLARDLGKSADAVKKMASRALQRLRAASSPSAMGAGQRTL
jgi:RNA polymerase sigma factor (sigma-70 family)